MAEIPAILDLRANWDDTYQISYEYKTDMVVSRSGKEQRRALRTSPRKTVEYKALAAADDFRRLNRFLVKRHTDALTAAELTRFTYSIAEMSPASDSVNVVSIPDWLTAGVKVALVYDDALAFFDVAAAVGTTIQFSTSSAATWPAGTKIHPALSGYLSKQIKFQQVTNRLAAGTVTFEVNPGSEPVLPIVAAPTSFNGRELFLMKPNWLNEVNWTYEHEVETVDYGRGRVARFLPIEFETRLFEATYLARSPAEAELLLAFFHRCLGQVGEFYMPTWTEDLVLRSTAFAGLSTMRTVGSDVHAAYNSDTVHKALAVFLRDGRTVFAKIANTFSVSDSIGDDTIIQVTTPWSFEMPTDEILMICWLPVWRHATDTLTIEWVTDAVAQTKLSLKTLEDLPAA